MDSYLGSAPGDLRVDVPVWRYAQPHATPFVGPHTIETIVYFSVFMNWLTRAAISSALVSSAK